MKDFENVLKVYLEQMAAQDTMFAERYSDPNKSIEECAKYVVGEVKKRLKSGSNMVCVPDAEIYGMAVHYYQEKDLKVDGKSEPVKVATPTTTTAATPKKRGKKAKAAKTEQVPEVAFEVPLFDI